MCTCHLVEHKYIEVARKTLDGNRANYYLILSPELISDHHVYVCVREVS